MQIGIPTDHVVYGQGDWIAIFIPTTSGSITLKAAYQTGRYVRIGNLVTLTGHFIVDSVNLPVGDLRISGLPFQIGNNLARNWCSVSIVGFGLAGAAITSLVGFLGISNVHFHVYKYAAGATSALAGDIQANTAIAINFSYEIL